VGYTKHLKSRRRSSFELGVIAVPLVLAAGAIAGCGDGGGNASADGGGSEYVIGAPLALTGGLAPYDGSALNGMKLAAEEINKAGGIDGKYKVKLVVRDTRSQTAQNAVLAQELVGSGAQALATACDDDPSIAAGRIAQQHKIVAISTCAANPALPQAVGPFMFTNWPSEALEGARGAEYAYKQGFRRGFVIYSKSSIFQEKLPKAWGERFQELGGELPGMAQFTVGDTDFSAQITQIRQANPDVIETAMQEPEFPAFMRQLRAAGVKTQVFGADGIDTDTITGYGGVLDDVIFTSGDFPSPGSPLAEFNAAYEKRFDEKPAIYAAYGYAMLKSIIPAAVASAKTTDPIKVRDAIDQISDLPTVVGPVTYRGQKGLAARSVVVLQLAGGKPKLLERLGGE
jgi:branched-chain amino acid transport system substrate-binding protein